MRTLTILENDLTFSIHFLDEPLQVVGEDRRAAYGMIRIGDFEERFLSWLDYWGMTDYEHQWQEGVSRIVNGADVSYLITSISDISVSAATAPVSWWVMYRCSQSEVFIQNQLLLVHELDRPFDPNDAAALIEPRCTKTEEGERVSEWVTTVDELAEFIRRKGHSPDYS